MFYWPFLAFMGAFWALFGLLTTSFFCLLEYVKDLLALFSASWAFLNATMTFFGASKAFSGAYWAFDEPSWVLFGSLVLLWPFYVCVNSLSLFSNKLCNI